MILTPTRRGDKRPSGATPTPNGLTVCIHHVAYAPSLPGVNSAVLIAPATVHPTSSEGLAPSIEVLMAPPPVGTGATRTGAILIFYRWGPPFELVLTIAHDPVGFYIILDTLSWPNKHRHDGSMIGTRLTACFQALSRSQFPDAEHLWGGKETKFTKFPGGNKKEQSDPLSHFGS